MRLDMSRPAIEAEARRLITERCLIAADIDKTLVEQLSQQGHERRYFLEDVAPELIRAARQGVNLAFITGNSMVELSDRFFFWLIEQLCFGRALELIGRFHFFCNSGGIYAHIPSTDEAIARLVAVSAKVAIPLDDALKSLMWEDPESHRRVIHPRFIDTSYIKRTSINLTDAAQVSEIVERVAAEFQQQLIDNVQEYAKIYRIDRLDPDGSYKENQGLSYELTDREGYNRLPSVDMRLVHYGSMEPYQTATVQITLKPVLSFRFALEPVRWVGKDFRSDLINSIQAELDKSGFDQYVARPGGRSSVDITLEKVDKAYAIEFLIDHLNLQPTRRKGLKYGSNAIYLGDEVIVGDGNDYPVTRVPGVLVLAVNPDRILVPSLSGVLVPSTILTGSEAVAEILGKFNNIAKELVKQYEKPGDAGRYPSNVRTAIEVFEERIFVSRIKDLIGNWNPTESASIEDLQVLHTFVTLMCRDDPVAHRWLAILVGELDAIMTHLAETSKNGEFSIIPQAYGTHAVRNHLDRKR